MDIITLNERKQTTQSQYSEMLDAVCAVRDVAWLHDSYELQSKEQQTERVALFVYLFFK